MEIHEITCNADADTLIAEYIRSTPADAPLMANLDDKVNEWTEEFDALDREIKVRKSEDINHYKLNKIIGLYFLIPTASFYINNWKANGVEDEIPVFSDATADTDPQGLWNKDNFFPSEPE